MSNTASGDDSESDSEMSLFDFLQTGPPSTPKSPRGSGVKKNLKQSAPSRLSPPAYSLPKLNASSPPSHYATMDSASLASSDVVRLKDNFVSCFNE